MKRKTRGSAWWPLALCAVAWGLLSCSQAPPPASGEPAPAGRDHLRVEDAWSRPAPAGGNGAVYLTVVNVSEEPDRLLAARCGDAAATELHEVQMVGDVMRMAPVEGGLEVPGGGRLELAPAGHHLMVIGLAKDFPAGDELALVLEFERGGEVTVRVPVAVSPPRTGE